MTEAAVRSALDKLVDGVRRSYGDRLVATYRVERMNELEEADRSDAEIVVVIEDGSWDALDEARLLAGLAFELLMNDGPYVRAWPVSRSGWDDPALAELPDLITEFKRQAQPLREAA